jgi:hypothetical protein
MMRHRMHLADAHAVVIGISRYQRVPPLRATSDAEDVAAVLRDPASCAYPAGRVRLLLDEHATRDAIFAALDALARETTAASTAFVYFSGHGARLLSGGGAAYYLLPVDAAGSPRAELARTAISSAELSARLRAIPAARLTVVLDCCRAAELADPDLVTAGLGAKPSADEVAPLAHGRGRAVLAASRADGEAYAMPGARNSTFTAHLLRGLQGAAPAVGGVIRVCDLFHYVQQRVAAETAAQHPVFKAELEENYPIALLRGGAPEPLALPPPPDTAAYDVFLSYRHDDPDDRAWVLDLVVPYLESVGLRTCLEHRDFRLGANRIAETERAVSRSRYTAAVFTPAYIAGGFDELHWSLACHAAAEARLPRVIPLLRRRCDLSLHARMTAVLDVSHDPEVPAALQRLALALRQPPQSRLGG